MTVGEILRVVDATKANEYDDATKIGWINEVEGMIFCETANERKGEFVSLRSSNDKVSLPDPYTRIYFLYIYAMMAISNNEYLVYLKVIAEFEKAFAQYARFVIRNR